MVTVMVTVMVVVASYLRAGLVDGNVDGLHAAKDTRRVMNSRRGCLHVLDHNMLSLAFFVMWAPSVRRGRCTVSGEDICCCVLGGVP
jgi:hypothetical protein